MRACLRYAILSSLITAAAPASAWERFIGVDPFWIQNVAPAGALSVDAAGNVCLLSNDRVGGSIEFAHVFTLDAQGQHARPWQVVGSNEQFGTLGVDCRFGPPVLAYRELDGGSQYRTTLVAYSDDRLSRWDLDLLSIGAAVPKQFGAAVSQSTVVLRQTSKGYPYDLQRFDIANASLQWQMNVNNWSYPGASARDMVVAADGSTTLLETYGAPDGMSVGTAVTRFDAQGLMTTSVPLIDSFFADAGPSAIAPGGTVYFARRSEPYAIDQLWQVAPQTGYPMSIYLGYGGSLQIEQVVALPDDGALVLAHPGYGSMDLLVRVAADGTQLWQTSVPQGQPGSTVSGLIGDRAGRALVVQTDPPGTFSRKIVLTSYDEQGLFNWSRPLQNARFDEGDTLSLAVTSDDNVVLALNAFDAGGNIPGILVQSFGLSSPTL
jgi:hypothetical protein